MAADRLLTVDYDTFSGYTQKIIKHESGAMLGLSGNYSQFEAMLYWFQHNTDGLSDPRTVKEKFGDVAGILVTSDEKVWTLENDIFVPCPTYKLRKYTAKGQGASFALGAMANGADAVLAVEIAIEHCNSCGGNVDVLMHDGVRK